MSRYADQEQRESQFRIWLAAAATGIGNVAFLYLLLEHRY